MRAFYKNKLALKIKLTSFDPMRLAKLNKPTGTAGTPTWGHFSQINSSTKCPGAKQMKMVG